MAVRIKATAKTNAQKKRVSRTKRAQQEELILQHLPLVKQVLGHVAAHLPPYVDREDLLEAGMIGLVDAAHRFDVERKVRFSTYAVTRIRGAMLDALRDEDWIPRSTRHELARIKGARCELAHQNNGAVAIDDICERLDISRQKVDRLQRVAAADGFHSLDGATGTLIER